MNKITLKVYPSAYMWIIWVGALFSLLISVLRFVVFNDSDDSLWETVIFSGLYLLVSIFWIVFALYSIQRAEISEEGIVIYSVVFSTIKVIKWNELIDVRTEAPISIYSRYRPPEGHDWIVLYTDQAQEGKINNMVNRRKTGPWYIVCTKENITVLTEYIIKYAPHICDDPDVFL